MRNFWTSRAMGPVLVFSAAVLWGVDGLFRRSLYSLPPITIVFYEHLIGAIIILPFFLRAARRETLTPRERWSILGVAALSGVLGTYFFTAALVHTNFVPLSVVFLLQKLQPIFAITLGVLVLRERIEKKFLIWAAVALLAAFFVTFPEGVINLTTGRDAFIAALFALGAAVAWGSSTAFSRLVLLRHSGTYVTGWRFLLTVPLALIFLLLLGQGSSLAAPEPEQYFLLVIIALSTGMIALWIYYRGLKFTQAKVATLLELAFPLTGILLDYLVYHQTLVWSQYLAGLILLIAMRRVSRLNRETRGYRYALRTTPGFGRGRQIGFPTINLEIPEKFPHHFGIYAGRVSFGGRTYPAAIHFGPVPTFKQNQPALEAYVLGEDIPEPPASLDLELQTFLRPIRSFANAQDLQAQIARDVSDSKRYLSPSPGHPMT